MSMFILLDAAQITELAANAMTDVNRMGLRPQISDNLTHIGPAAALASRYAPPIHVYPDAELKSDEMVGMAVDTMT